jgi:hypothetical protein
MAPLAMQSLVDTTQIRLHRNQYTLGSALMRNQSLYSLQVMLYTSSVLALGGLSWIIYSSALPVL